MTDVRLFADINAIDSLRNSDFDSVSAYGEVVDNSLEADAKAIHIRLDTRSGNRGYEHIERIVFGDDGYGMDKDTLHQCMQIGWSSRFNQRSGIGRFGVGMTMAAIHECKCVEIYSKVKDGHWMFTFMDLEKVANGQMSMIPEPINQKPDMDILKLAGDESGTIVVWSKYDRQSMNANALLAEMTIWLGRTYRHFIWDDDVKISLNGGEIKAIDPLYARTEKTDFPNDPKATEFDPITFDWPVDDFDAPPGSPDESEIRIRMSILPEEFRQRQGDGGKAPAVKRHIPMNEGISILRNRREVFYGEIPYWKSAGEGWPEFENIDRWWGCEISFDAVLDRAFTVKNIKRGAVPNTKLKAHIKSQIQPTRNDVLEKVRAIWHTTKLEDKRREQQEKTIQRPGDHLGAEATAKKTPTDTSELDKGKDFDQEAAILLARVSDQYDREQQAALKALFQSQPFTILERDWRGTQFFESNHLGGKAVLEYNMRHVFFTCVYDEIKKVEGGGDATKSAERLKELLDLLLIAYAKGEARFDGEQEMRAEDFIENLRTNWGQYLQSYVKTWMREGNSNGKDTA